MTAHKRVACNYSSMRLLKLGHGWVITSHRKPRLLCVALGLSLSKRPSWCRDHFVDAPSQWKTTLHSNVVSHWLGAFKKLSLLAYSILPSPFGLPHPTISSCWIFNVDLDGKQSISKIKLMTLLKKVQMISSFKVFDVKYKVIEIDNWKSLP